MLKILQSKLKKLLESNGIVCIKRSKEDIMEEVWKKAEDYFTRQIRQFIDKFQQIYIDDEEAFKQKAKSIEDDREKTFLYLLITNF